jgi:hypothetical protein
VIPRSGGSTVSMSCANMISNFCCALITDSEVPWAIICTVVRSYQMSRTGHVFKKNLTKGLVCSVRNESFLDEGAPQ